MIITYIGHSGFAVELPHCVLLFDVIAGEAPEPGETFDRGQMPVPDPDKALLVFVSHAHRDHYSPSVWELRKIHPRTTYILSKDVPFTSGIRKQLGIEEEDLSRILRVRAGQTYEVSCPGSDDIRIRTLLSTDQGTAYLAEAEGKTIYHAGDLHLWLWEEEGEKYMEKMRKHFDRFTAPLAGVRADCAFLPLDARLEEHTYDGMDAYLSRMQVSHCFPMHCWRDYDLIRRYKEARRDSLSAGEIHEISGPGQQFVI